MPVGSCRHGCCCLQTCLFRNLEPQGFFLRSFYPYQCVHLVLGLPGNQAVGYWKKKINSLLVQGRFKSLSSSQICLLAVHFQESSNICFIHSVLISLLHSVGKIGWTVPTSSYTELELPCPLLDSDLVKEKHLTQFWPMRYEIILLGDGFVAKFSH